MRTVRNTERVFNNKAAQKVLEIEKEHPGDFEKISHLVRGDNYREVFQESGDLDKGVWSAGTVMGLIDEVVTCEGLVNSIVEEAESIIAIYMKDSVVIDVDSPIVAKPRWILEYIYVDDVENARVPHRLAHIKLAREMKAAGKILMGGAHQDLKGAHIIFLDEESLDKFVEIFPCLLEGVVVTSFTKKEWTVVR